MAQDPASFENPHYALILDDVRNRSDWAAKDAEIVKRRLGERRKVKTKPYKGAPNSVVPIVDDATREKTDQEMTMILNARVFAHVIPLSGEMPSDLRAKAEQAFDTYLRHILLAAPKIEEADDMKNARGFSVVKTLRGVHPRFGEIPDFETRDIRDIILPADTKNIADSERVTDVFRYTPRQLRAMARRNKTWRNIETIVATCTKDDRDHTDVKSDLVDTFGVSATLIGVTTSGKSAKTIVIWEHYTYATEWDAKHDPTRRVKEGDKCRVVFCPDLPEQPVAVTPWRETDEDVPLDEAEVMVEMEAALREQRMPVLMKTRKGTDRPWPFVQPRYENRSRYFYDSRGIGQLCMDEQIMATGQQNAKMTMVDYYKLPMFTGPGSKSSTNISHEPGSFIPGDIKAVQLPGIPPQFDFDIELHRRNAGRRSGAMSQYEFSGDLSNKKRVQKTATEVTQESNRGTMVSSASVDRFNIPWAEVYQQLWDDLRRMKKELPIIQNFDYVGQAGAEIYQYPVLLVPASNAKTMNPDMQFARDTAAWDFVVGSLVPQGVVADAQEAATDILANWDPAKASRWIRDPAKAGPGQLPPVYQVLQQLTGQQKAQEEMLQAMQEAIEAIGKALAGGGAAG